MIKNTKKSRTDITDKEKSLKAKYNDKEPLRPNLKEREKMP
jgi:hypothetical protein